MTRYSQARRSTGQPRWALALSLLACVAACAAAGGLGPVAEPGAEHTPASVKIGQPMTDMQRMISTWAGQKQYSPRQTRPSRRPRLAKALSKKFQRLAQKSGQPPPVADWRLDRAAHDMAQIVRGGGHLAHATLPFAIQHHGVVEPLPMVLTVVTSGANDKLVLDTLIRQAKPWLRNRQFTSFGLGRARHQGADSWVLLLLRSHLRLDPLSRRQPIDGAFVLRGRFAGPLSQARLLVSRPAGGVEDLVLSGKRPKLQGTVRCGGERGTHRIEIVADRGQGVEVLANFPVYCGVPPPAELAWRKPAAEEDLDPRTAERKLVQLINRERSKAGLNPVEVDPALQRVAENYSQEMVRTGVVAHVSKESGTVVDRLEHVGLRRAVVAENLARSLNAGHAHRGLMDSPGHRANILMQEATQVGVGVALDGSAGEPGSRGIVVTEIFTGSRRPVDPAVAQRQMVKRMPKRLRHDTVLDEVAALQLAQISMPGGAADDMAEGASGHLVRRKYDAKRLVARLMVVSSVEAFDIGALPKRDLRHFGLAVRQGPHPQVGARALYVLVLLVAR